ncbi:MAG: TonB-dependent receptor [Acidobacteria bacterium]|nr:TonB-dependent receptor [Acidobacteriota bacterium]
MRHVACLGMLAVLLFSSSLFWAQSNRATITGTVSDVSGAVINDVDISATNKDTGVVTRARSNDAGLYSVLNLPAGSYTLRLSKDGFKPLEFPSISLSVAQVAQINATLPVGATTEVVTVTENAPVIDRETSTVGTNMKGNVVTDLPLNIYGGRTVEQFAVAITPGYSPISSPYQAVVNGTQGFTKDFTVDGTSGTAQIQGDSMEIGPSMEAVEEMQAQTSGLGAKNASTNGGVMMFNLKSGTNTFHGTAFGYGHNELLDANTWDNGNTPDPNVPGSTHTRKAKARFWDYGFSAGGPVFKNKTFIFGAFERFQQRDFTLQSFGNAATVPTQDFLNGDFSALLDTNTVLGTDVHGNNIYKGAIFNPNDPGAVFIGNVIDPNVTPFSAVSQKIVAIYQQRYNPERDTIKQNNRLPNSNSPVQTPNQAVIKIDHNLRDNDRLSGSWVYNHRPRTLVDSGGVWSPGSEDGGPLADARYQLVRSHQFRASESHTFSPNVLNVFNATYNWYWNGSTPLSETNWPQELGFGDTGANNFPNISFGGSINDVGTTGIGNGWQGHYNGATLILGDTLTWIRGRHSFSFGGDFRAMQINSATGSGALGFTFSPTTTGAPSTGYANQVGFGFASFLLGNVQSASASTPLNLHGRRKAMSLYAQDDFKVSSKLTLNLGLRWDATFRLHEKDGRWANFNMEMIDPNLGIKGAVEYAKNGSDSFERDQDWTNFGPQVGFAYNPWSKVVFRGAYGITYVPIGTQYWAGTPYSFAPGFRGTNATTSPFNWDGGYPGVFEPGTKSTTAPYTQFPVVSVDPRSLFAGYTHNFNFGAQYEINRNTKIEIGYVGNRGHRLQDSSLYANQPSASSFFNLVNSGHFYDWVYDQSSADAAGVPYPYEGFSNYAFIANAPYPQLADPATQYFYYPNFYVVGLGKGQSSYNSLILEVAKRTGNGLSLDFNYTLSRQAGDTFTNFGESWSTGGIQDYGNLKEAVRTLSPYDQKHVFKGYAVYDLPLGRGHRVLGNAGRVLNAVVSGWSVSTLLLYTSGAPLSFYSSNYYWYPAWQATYVDYDLSGYSGRTFDPGKFPTENRYFPTSVASNPDPGQLGTGPARIDQLRGFGTASEDAGLMKRFAMGKDARYQLSLRLEFYNIFNRHGFANPVTDLTSADFGVVTGVSGTPRNGQFGARFQW